MAAHENGKIGLFAATVIGVNAMIGAGIFAMPAKLAHTVGLASILSYAVSGVLILFIVFALGRLAVWHPGDAWGYRYPSLWGGHAIGMVSAFGYVGGVTVAMGFLTQQLGVWVAPYAGGNPLAWGIGLLAVIVLLVLAGAEVSSWGQYVIAACVLVPMVVASAVCLLHAQPALTSPFAPYGYGAVVQSLPTILFSLLGFESISSLYRVVDRPAYNVPRAAIYAVALVVCLFALFIGSALVAIDKSFFAGGVSCPFSVAVTQALPQYHWLALVTSIGAFFAIFGTLHSMVWSVAELFLDVLRKGQSPLLKAITNRRFCRPAVGIIVIGVATASAAYLLQADTILAVVVGFISLSYLLSVMALLFDRRTWQSLSGVILALGATASTAWLFGLSARSMLSLLEPACLTLLFS